MKMLAPARWQYTSANTKIIAHGNSYTRGIGSGASDSAHTWPALCAGFYPLAGTGLAVDNQGVNGQSLVTLGSAPSTMLGTGPTAVDARTVAGRLNILIVWEGQNELAQNGQNAANCFAAHATYIAARRAAAQAAGKKLWIIVTTMWQGYSPSGPADTRARGVIKQAVNNELRARYREIGANQLMDMGALWPYGDFYQRDTWLQSEYINTTYQGAGVWDRSDATPDDYSHPGDSGQSLNAQYFARALARVPANAMALV